MAGPMMMKFFRQSWSKAHHDVKSEIPASGKVVLITGANQGIGETTTREFAKRGATVLMACRDIAKAKRVMEDIKFQLPDSQIEIFHLDLGDMSSVRKCAGEIRLKHQRIDILINNAGMAFNDGKVHKTVDGFEAHIGTNHLGHFLLTSELLDLIKSSPAGRIVNLTSGIFELALPNFDPDDLMLEKYSSFDPNWIPFANSKLANMYFTKALAKYLRGSGVTATVMCPGSVRTPGQTAGIKNESWFVRKLAQMISVTPEEGVETLLFLCLSNKSTIQSGGFYRFCKIFEPIPKLNDEHERKLWERSKALVGVELPDESSDNTCVN